MNKTATAFISIFLFFATSCHEKGKTYVNSDLSFFNLTGKVKKFSEINVGIGLSESADFETFASQQVNYYEHYFSKEGELLKIENINPSPYAVGGFRITFSRDGDSLVISQDSPKEKYVRTYSIKGDTLNVTAYNKIVDNENDYHSEKYKQYTCLKQGKYYIMNAYCEGINKNQVYEQQHYVVVKNHNGFDSLIYLKQQNGDTVPLYSVKYLGFDKNGNWLTRQFIKNKHFQGQAISYTLYRNIEYYE